MAKKKQGSLPKEYVEIRVAVPLKNMSKTEAMRLVKELLISEKTPWKESEVRAQFV